MEAKQNNDIKVKIQRFGSYLSGMVMPNIGAFIAWGLITALFIPDGWLPNESLAELVGPMITYLLPLLIGFTGGRMVHDLRGGVVGATATMGVIVGADIPMFLGAMIIGPIGGYAIKKVDQLFQGKVKSGFEMLVNNFSAGIVAGILSIIGYLGIGPVVLGITQALGNGLEVIVNANLLPLASIFVEPAKVLFLNNALNHGVFGPIAVEQAANAGKSILFLIESNPGPGLGILLAYMFFGKGSAKQSSPGAAVIHFLGGIHEIYFPYILMKPLLILAAIAGGASGILTFMLTNTGLVATPSPGSIIAITAMTPRGNFVGMFLGVIVATLISFLVASVILKSSKKEAEDDIESAAAKMQEMKGKKSNAASFSKEAPESSLQNVKNVIFACDAGMGSSAMGASVLKNKFKKAGLSINVTNKAINNLPEDADVIITHKDLTERAKAKRPNAYHISVENFLNSPKYDELVKELAETENETDETKPENNEMENVEKIIFACDAGMGSSAMGASVLKNKLKKAGLSIDVTNSAINNLPNDADIIITHKDLTDRAKAKVPAAHHISVDNFLNSPKYDELVEKLK
ncbi:PTS mannitol-specific transporter subunit IIBC [Metabacillus arenae]|uniref:PTS system mannitol-specific EIICB component n=1 Tax=Metabacillus arenae TaxID=2771434 RepID=A0A926NLQ8_9BACI|nr:PTS mannitol-specific transporter subunit IIBC [Metabacillus arenae]MBD1383025.1 PTS mannitol transporter subunit IICBA [Metabacillus arenae]